MSKTDLTPPAAGSAVQHSRRRFRIPEEIGVIIALVGMMGIIGFARPRFLNPINLFSLLGNTTFLGMLAIGMVFLLAIREIDLSVGWMFNFSAVFAALLMVAGVDPWLAAFAGILFGAGLGLINGLIAITLRLPAIIVTLGTYSMFQGLSLIVNKGRAIVPPDQSSSFFSVISEKLYGVVPVAALVFIALAIAMYVGFRGAIDPNEGSDFVLVVIAAVIIGGTPLSGGHGTIIGAVIGMMIIQVISSGLIFFGIDATWSTFVTGAVTVLAVSLDRLIKFQRTRRIERSKESFHG
jgi:ribose transport system permease protein